MFATSQIHRNNVHSFENNYFLYKCLVNMDIRVKAIEKNCSIIIITIINEIKLDVYATIRQNMH